MNLNKVYSCVICGDEFESRQAVNEHLEDEHGCENDDFALNTKLSLKLIKTSKTEDSEDEDVTIVGDGQAPVIKAVSHSTKESYKTISYSLYVLHVLIVRI